MTEPSRRTVPLPLDFIIVGGGLAGLAVAHALCSTGHRVRVFEKSRGTSRWAAGIRLPPNGMLVLLKWGVGEKVKAKSVKCTATDFVDMGSGARLGALEWREEVMKELGAPFYMIAHSDMHSILCELALSSGAEVHFDTPVACVNPGDSDDLDDTTLGSTSSEGRPSITLANGEVIHADIIIGADGADSIVRPLVDEVLKVGEPSRTSIYHGSIPVATMQADPNLASIIRDLQSPHWLGTSSLVLSYPVRSGEEYNATFWVPEPIPRGAPQGWDTPVSSRDVKYPAIEPRITALLGHIPTLTRVSRDERGQAESFVDESERIVLVGEAAHPLGPCGMPVLSAVLEDAAVLGVLFSRLRSHDQISPLLYGYEDLRKPRRNTLADLEDANHYIIMLPPGPERDFRNDAWNRWKKAAEARGDAEIEEGELEQQFAELCGVWGYDAIDAAEDWWVQWGMLRERALGMGGGGVLDGTVRMEVVGSS
ncbi:FAD/NAD-P-binding domain-containing protein [Stereum hirsutum FP-91666 SS1]|uniref:FAD/NAD-P-binding domain-containing protein n=1 Tax=Stereum hirsutum (strain FP-91666) TaxID=721885 RepID=UPI0004449F8F|nr:FAD/NAD-P-binding domain-containing protein [Stereum hirsutum FP-91666 SS1]EIM83988.1 FAD/NAD-P-binding domain-containing protein [Stereum hirsutum FP-91666 SS1]